MDGEFWTELDAGVAMEHGLAEGIGLSFEELTEVRVAGEKPLAMSRALNVLGYRPRAEGELRERLLRAGYAGETVEVVLLRLKELGYLDDGEFAREKVRSEARKRYGPHRIYGSLRRAGVGENTALGAIEEEFAQRNELEDARAAAERRYSMYNIRENVGDAEAGAKANAQARRVYYFLLRRGYSAEVCSGVAQTYRRAANK